MSGRTNQQIVDDTNVLARELYRFRGYVSPGGYRFDQATHPHEVEAWRVACWVTEYFTATDPEEALANLEEEA